MSKRLFVSIPSYCLGFMDQFAQVDATRVTAHIVRCTQKGIIIFLDEPFCFGKLDNIGPSTPQQLFLISHEGKLGVIDEDNDGEPLGSVIHHYSSLFVDVSHLAENQIEIKVLGETSSPLINPHKPS